MWAPVCSWWACTIAWWDSPSVKCDGHIKLSSWLCTNHSGRQVKSYTTNETLNWCETIYILWLTCVNCESQSKTLRVIQYLFEVGLLQPGFDTIDRHDEIHQPNCLLDMNTIGCPLHCRENSNKQCVVVIAPAQAEKHVPPTQMVWKMLHIWPPILLVSLLENLGVKGEKY